MFSALLSAEVQSFIRRHEQADTSQLLLQYDQVGGVPMSALVQQIVGRRKAREKLPLWYRTDGIIYPPQLNLEQCSSEATAQFKSTYAVQDVHPKQQLADLTGGFGIDSYFFGLQFDQVYHVEPDGQLLQVAQHNHAQLGMSHITYRPSTAEDFLRRVDHSFDCLYIDPSRRSLHNRKVYTFADCTPDITQWLGHIFEKTAHLLVKASPLLDIQQGIKELRHVKKVFVLAVQNECRELLFSCDRHFDAEPTLEAVNLFRDNTMASLSFRRSEEQVADVQFSEPLQYLYEPNAAILKAGAFKTIGARFNLYKLHPNTHFYTSTERLSNFPGNVFRIVAQVRSAPKSLREFFPNGKANVTTRNYPLSAPALKAKCKLQDGGERFLIGFTGGEKKYLVVAEKVN